MYAPSLHVLLVGLNSIRFFVLWWSWTFHLLTSPGHQGITSCNYYTKNIFKSGVFITRNLLSFTLLWGYMCANIMRKIIHIQIITFCLSALQILLSPRHYLSSENLSTLETDSLVYIIMYMYMLVINTCNMQLTRKDSRAYSLSLLIIGK